MASTQRLAQIEGAFPAKQARVGLLTSSGVVPFGLMPWAAQTDLSWRRLSTVRPVETPAPADAPDCDAAGCKARRFARGGGRLGLAVSMGVGVGVGIDAVVGADMRVGVRVV
eukprot:5611347-Pleurochrysis_carterae.AAC.1